MISIDDLVKCELRVAKILECERVENSEKLVKLKVSLGGEPEESRQIIAGIGKVYSPDVLIGKEIIIVANLEPRILMGLESQGMLLAADGDDGPALLVPDRIVGVGKKIK